MSETNHTPGPWVAGFGHQYAFRVCAGSLDGPIIANCNCQGGVATGLEAAANATLISAAPELYASVEALIEVIERTEARQGTPVKCSLEQPCTGLSCDLCDARAALAKARGGTR